MSYRKEKRRRETTGGDQRQSVLMIRLDGEVAFFRFTRFFTCLRTLLA